MKPSLCLLIPALFLVSCDQQEIDASMLVTRNETAYEVNSNTPFTGVSLTYHQNGAVDDRVTFKDGKQNGLLESYFENGTREFRANMKDGERDGIAEGYSENGSVVLRANYKGGKTDGLMEGYFEDGTLVFRGNWKDGELLGRCFEVGCTDFN